MSRADWIYLKTTNNILKSGNWDINEVVRPKWADGTSAHTAKVFAVNNVYDLQKEFPIVITLGNSTFNKSLLEKRNLSPTVNTLGKYSFFKFIL